MSRINLSREGAAKNLDTMKVWEINEIDKLNFSDRLAINAMIKFMNESKDGDRTSIGVDFSPDSVFRGAEPDGELNRDSWSLREIEEISPEESHWIVNMFKAIGEFFAGVGNQALFDKIHDVNTKTGSIASQRRHL